MADIAPNIVVSMPSQIFTQRREFKSCSNGKIYIGKIDTDPTIAENQIPVYLENEDGKYTRVAQPLIIGTGGYPVYNGQIAKFVTEEGHAIAVYDGDGVQQFYFPNVLKYEPKKAIKELYDALDTKFDKTGGTVNGSLHVTQAIHVGDNDSGLRANGDGSVAFYANNTKVAAWNNDRLHWIKNIETGGALIAWNSVKTGKGQTTLQPDGNIHGPVWGGHLNGWVEKRIRESSACWVNGDNWWYKDFRAGIEFITQGGFVEVGGQGLSRVTLHARVSNRLLHVSIITVNFGQGNVTWNPQVQGIAGEREGFNWYHGSGERKMYWCAIGY